VLQDQDGLDQPGDTGGGLGVPQVGLDRPNPEGGIWAVAGPQHGVQGAKLDRVAQAGSGPVGLDVADSRGLQTRGSQGLPQDLFLGSAVGRRQAVAAAVLVAGGSADQRQHPVPVAPGRREGFEDDHAGALAAHVAVGRGVEALAATVRRQGAQVLEILAVVRKQQQVDPTGQGHPGLAAAQAHDGQVDGHQRGRAGSVDGQAGALRPQVVGEPTRSHAGGVARARPGVAVTLAGQQGLVVVGT